MRSLFYLLYFVFWIILPWICICSAKDRTFTIANRGKETIWVGTFGYTNNCATQMNPEGGGFQLPPKKTIKISVPNDWCSGRIWARTGCTTASGKFKCETGDCGGPKAQCAYTAGAPPATLVEFTLQKDPSTTFDTYDVSIVDGFNVGVDVQPIGGTKVDPKGKNKYDCGAPSCGTPSRPFKKSACPKELRTKDGKHCMSICQAVSVPGTTQDLSFIRNFDKNLVCCECGCGPNCGCNDGKNAACKYGCSPLHPTNPPYNYQWNGVCDSALWPKSSNGKSYPSVFKDECPSAYSWQFDDQKSTYICKGADYAITFYDAMQ